MQLAYYGPLYEHTQEQHYLDSTRAYAQKALEAARAIGYYKTVGQSYNLLSGISLLEANYQKAILYADSTLALRGLEGVNYRHFESAHYKKSDAYLGLGLYKEAKVAADSSYHYAKIQGSWNGIVTCLERVYKCQKQLGNYEEALTTYEEYKVLLDSLNQKDKTKTINELEQKYNKVQNEKEINELTQKQEIDSLRIKLLGLGIAISLLALLGAGILYRQRNLRNQQKILEAEQRLNRSRMDPHFFFNALASVHSAMLEGKSNQETANYLARSTQMMRQSLESSYNDLIPIEEEIEFLENYMELQKIRYNNSFDYSIEADGQIEPSEVLVPSMLTQPFVENAIEHGVSGLKGEGHITIRFVQKSDILEITIQDNGTGISNNSPKTHQSRALQIVQDRLFLLNKKQKSKASVRLIEAPDIHGVIAMIQIPVMYEQ